MEATQARPKIGSTVSWRMGHNGELRSGRVEVTSDSIRGVRVRVDCEVSPFTRDRWIQADCLIGFGTPTSARERESLSWNPPDARYQGD